MITIDDTRCIDVHLTRPIGKTNPILANHGLLVTVKTIPDVEDLFKSWGDGTKQHVTAHGRNWVSKNNAAPLHVYNLSSNSGLLQRDEGRYRIDHVGQLLDTNDPSSGLGATNMSFLRLVGISNPEGVSFYVRGVYSQEEMRLIAKGISLSARRIYANWLCPIDLRVVLTLKEMKG